MKSARERAIDIIHASGGKALPYSRETMGRMIAEAGHTMPDVMATIKNVEEQIEADRRELLAWAKEAG